MLLKSREEGRVEGREGEEQREKEGRRQRLERMKSGQQVLETKGNLRNIFFSTLYSPVSIM